ncbi:hypothetical protein [Streptomyces genisteinicus]|uniref:Sugar phosphate isomerase/epimerase n=1 Tax=Streptomyces genisteinicus TaxID=2768068 RepID=A0A7H0I513_9ACTN|nr:hypothetical protein [Streptomyces genisteinicus]QNP67879.1 hypothetical protein IAG43_33595 [Streptomyces genisteinicus]
MTPDLGLSSGSAPELDADGLAALTLRLGGDAVDVRASKGHAWEGSGGLRALRAAGVRVCFVGHSTVLGRPGSPPADPAWLEDGLPVKVFAAEGCTAPEHRDRTRRQIAALAAASGGPGNVLVETHHGYAPVPELRRLCEETGVRLLLDTLGLARIHPDPVAAAAELAPWISYAQVKGFDPGAPGTGGHLPLEGSRAAWTGEVLAAAGELRAVTVESRAGALDGDLAVLRDLYRTPATAAAPGPGFREETAP